QDLDAVEDRNALHGALGGRDLAAGDELEPVPDLDLAGDPVEGAGGGHDREVDVDRLRDTRALAQLEFHLYRRRPGASGAHRAHLDDRLRRPYWCSSGGSSIAAICTSRSCRYPSQWRGSAAHGKARGKAGSRHRCATHAAWWSIRRARNGSMRRTSAKSKSANWR